MSQLLRTFIVLTGLLTTCAGWSQTASQKELERKRSSLIEEIELTSKLVNQVKKKKEATLSDVRLMETQLKKRNELVRTIDAQVIASRERVQLLSDSLEYLEGALTESREEYGLILNRAHIRSRLRHPFHFLVDGASIFEGFRKWIYLRQFKTFILRKLEGLRRYQADLKDRTEARIEELRSQTVLLEEAKEEKLIVSREKSTKEKLLSDLKKDSKNLESKLAEQQRERRKLSKAIEKLILAEMEKKRKEEEASSALSAEARVLSGAFVGNKGRLPWPLKKGVITSGFGKQSHPDIKGVYMDNTGIDFVTDEGGPVQAVFNGTVVGTTRVAGQHNMVVVSHGDYYTVYSKLVTVMVQSGQSLRTGDPIGKTGRAVDGLGNFHFEIWQGKSKVDPEDWISKK